MRLTQLLLAFCSVIFAQEVCADAKKKILIIFGNSSHQNYCHNNKEVGLFLEKKLKASSYANQFEVTSSYNYPKDLTLVEEADLIIISSDGGPNHALAEKGALTKHTLHLDSVLKKNQTGLMMLHWATDAPSSGFRKYNPVNGPLMIDWIGAVYYWDKDLQSSLNSWTWKFPVLELKVNKSHPIANGLPDTFKLQDEYYFNFFTEGADSRNPKPDNVTYIHTASAADTMANQDATEQYREQPVYWACEREDEGRSVALTSAHMYHTWANPHFFKTFANSILWTLKLPIPEEGADMETPTLEELLEMSNKVQIHTKALHFK